MAKVINVDSLNRTSEQYDPILRMLPFRDLQPRVREMGFRLLSSDKELREVSYERKGGIAKPYAGGTTDVDAEYETAIGKTKEMVLSPQWGYTALTENIMNYEGVNVIGNAPEHVDPQTKKHPQEMLILQSVVKTVGEDLLDALYFAERDITDKSPLGLFDGINTLVDAMVSSGDIAAGNGNLQNSGVLTNGSSGADLYRAYTNLITWLRKANWALRKGSPILKMSYATYYNVLDALTEKLQYKGVLAFEEFLRLIRGDSGIMNLNISIEEEMGSGHRLYLTVPNNFDFSLWTQASQKFVQPRQIFKDPNDIQYWSQWKAGARVRNIHAKSFMMNEQSAVANQLSGDYLS